MFSIVDAASVTNPLEDSGVLTALFSFLKAFIVAALPILILLIVFGGFLFVIARGSKDALKNSWKYLYKVFFVVLLVLSLVMIAQIFISFLSTLYNAF